MTDAERRIQELEAELARERALSLDAQRRLVTKDREMHAIYASRAWRLVGALRSLKYRYVDPLLGRLGVAWPRRRFAAARGGQAVSARTAQKYDVVCFSVVEWDFRYQRPQQLMSRFAAAGHRVFYVSQEVRGSGPAWEAVTKAPNVFEVTFRDGAAFEGLAALRRDAALEAAVMFVHFPSWWPIARQARAELGWPVLYDCMDHHAGFATVHRTMIAAEAELLAEADVVIATSAALERNARKYRHDVVLLRNACEPEHFGKTPRARNARALNAKPTIGFYGAIAECFDPALVAELAVRRPDWDFLLVGSAYGGDVSRLARLPNVTLPGEQPYESMPEWLGRFDVAIIPFRRTPLTEATNPVKVYEMLAGGKPVVSVPIPEVAALAPLVRLASTAEEFEREIAGALAGDTDAAADERRAFARRQTWELRFEVLAAAAANALARASVDGVVRRVRASRGAVIFPPSIGWYVDLVQRPHHLARAFARKGFTVIFDTSNAHDPVAGFEEIEPNLFLFAGDEELLTRIPEPLLWTLPYNFDAVDRYPRGTRTVYDWIDDLSVFGQDARFVERTHARGLREATLVTTVARTLRSAEREDALYLPNAVDCAHFAETREARLLDLPADGKPLAGYYGAIASWFDFDLLDDVARLREDWNFVLIGAALDASLTRHPLFSRANVLWLGPRMYATLPAYLHAFDAAMIPFAVNRITNATSPLKLYEYFAGGKPVIATPLPECAQFPEVTIAATAAEFAAALDVARGRDEEFRERLRAIAAANSWEARVDAVLARLGSASSSTM